jgi:hypothetical protein
VKINEKFQKVITSYGYPNLPDIQLLRKNLIGQMQVTLNFHSTERK